MRESGRRTGLLGFRMPRVCIRDHVAIRGLHLSRPFQGNPSHVTHPMALVAWQRGLPTLVRPPSTWLLHQTSRPLTA
ncbi:hypothetical protein V6N13_142287 [Hibiscus sabdariffa]